LAPASIGTMKVDHPSAEVQAGGWSAGNTGRSRDGPARGEAAVRGLVEPEAVGPRAARVFLFLLPSGRPWWRGSEGAAAAAGAVFLPLPLGWLGPRLFRAPSPPRARAAPAVAAVVGAAAAAAARAARVFWLRLPFGRPRFRDAGGIITGVLVFFLLPFGRPGPVFSGTPSPLATEPPREDMAGQNEEKVEAEEEVECALNPKRS
jgi:hypothetical protein